MNDETRDAIHGWRRVTILAALALVAMAFGASVASHALT